jgi:predicted amidophosphoribosyltransferase
MVVCPNCKRENDERNYYCSWCDSPLKHSGKVKQKKLKERYNYLIDLNVIDEQIPEKDYFSTYNSKKKK